MNTAVGRQADEEIPFFDFGHTPDLELTLSSSNGWCHHIPNMPDIGPHGKLTSSIQMAAAYVNPTPAIRVCYAHLQTGKSRNEPLYFPRTIAARARGSHVSWA